MNMSLRKSWDRVAFLVLAAATMSSAAVLAACGALTDGADGGGMDGGAALESGGNALVDAGLSGDADVDGAIEAQCSIQASDYDQSCTDSTECVDIAPGGFLVEFGDFYCKTQHCLCPTDSINVASGAKYALDVLKTPLGSEPWGSLPCECGNQVCGPRCVAGHCVTGGTSCLDVVIPSGGDAGVDDAEAPATAVDGGEFCSFNNGVMDADIGDAGPSRWCTPPEKCESINGGWECCVGQGLTTCVPPVGQ